MARTRLAGKGKPGSGRGSVVPAGVVAWPISPRSTETKKRDPKKLATHVGYYGSECVAETMAGSGLAELPLLAYATTEPEGRRMTQDLRQLIHRLTERGFVVDAVAKTLNLKPARVKRVLREPESGGLAESA